ncbi:MAG: EscU/YscU/HrcU family type III secretion system export apparatus switch protein [Planctomycetota bacterium]|jgi:flagellar biosynthesis protein
MKESAEYLRKREEKRRQLAVALRYNEDKEQAPRVIAKGSGNIADKIIEIAEKQNIPVREDPDLIETLSQLDLGDVIPGDLYPAVAELLAFIYRTNNKAAEA